MPNLTIKDIARISGCSVSTISRVINDRPDVRPETKEHVLKVMREAGFVPNTNARQLKIQQSRSLVFVVKGTRNLFFSDFLVQLQRAATLYGYNGIVSYLDENANEIDAAEHTSICCHCICPLTSCLCISLCTYIFYCFHISF